MSSSNQRFTHLGVGRPLGQGVTRHSLLPRHLAAGLVGMLIVGGACRGNDRAHRERLLERADAEQLVGAWDVTLVIERPLTPLQDARATARPVTGMLAFTENRNSEETFADFGGVTHKGAYDLDLTSLGLPLGDDARTQSAVARTVPVRGAPEHTQRRPAKDSVFIALLPGGSHLSIRLTGLLVGDTIAGSWIAEFARASASGRFSMQRRRPAP
jgi:hypothetical protein